MKLTESARTEVARFMDACTKVESQPLLPALVFCLRSRAEGGDSELNGMSGFWDLGSYDRAMIPTEAIVDVGGIAMVIEPGYRPALMHRTIDYIDGRWYVS